MVTSKKHLSKYHVVIGKFLKANSNINWAAEIKICKELFLWCPEEIFWAELNLGFQLNSLAWFKTPDGKKRLRSEYTLFKLTYKDKEKNINLDFSAENVLEFDKDKGKKKNKNIIDFIDNK